MDFWSTLLVVLRRWYVALPVFALSVVGTSALYSSVPMYYTSASTMVLATPLNGGTASASTSRTNPLLNFRADLVITSSVLTQSLNDPAVMQDLLEGETPDTKLIITNSERHVEALSAGPFLFITGESTSAASAQRVTERAASVARERLDIIQREIEAPARTFIKFTEAQPATTPQANPKSKVRAAVAVLGFGLIATLVSAFMAESFAAHRRRRRPPDSPPVPAGVGGRGDDDRPGSNGAAPAPRRVE